MRSEYFAARMMTIMDTTIKSSVYKSGLMKIILNAKAVDMSVINVAANIVLIKFESRFSVSISTEYTTASEVVDSAIPAISAACRFQNAMKYV